VSSRGGADATTLPYGATQYACANAHSLQKLWQSFGVSANRQSDTSLMGVMPAASSNGWALMGAWYSADAEKAGRMVA